MNQNCLKAKHQFNGGLIFKILYLLLGFLSFNSISANSTFLTVYSFALTGIGGCYFIYRLVHFDRYKKTKGLLILSLFFVSYAISSIVTFRYGVVSNIKAMIWLGMHFFLLFPNSSQQTAQDIKRECVIIGWVVLAYTFLVSLMSVGCLVLDYYHYKVVNGIGTITGFLWNRLWGFYSDPNYGAVLSVVSILLSVFYLSLTKKKFIKALLLINVLVEVCYIAFSDSRTAQIAMVVSFAWAVVVLAGKTQVFAKIKPVLKQAVVVCLAVVVGASGLLAVKGAGALGNKYLSAVHDKDSVLFYWMDPEKKEQLLNLPPSTVPQEPGVEQIPGSAGEHVVGRPIEDMGGEGGDISNRRFSIWNSAFEVFKTSPVVGVSFRNIVPYAKDNLPETYIVNNNQSDFASMHNMFIDVMVSQGIVGLVLLAVFMAFVLLFVFKRLFRLQAEQYGFCAALLCVIVPIVVSGFFYSEIFYMNTAGAVLFWVALGYLMTLTEKASEC